MTGIVKKYGRTITIAILAAILLSLIPAAMNGFKLKEASAGELSADERKTAADISNTTGAKIEEILDLRKQGKSWNEILEKLRGSGKNSGDREERGKLLANDGLGEDTLDKLKKEGFKEEEIMEAKLLAERVSFQLHEITGANEIDPGSPKVETAVPGDPLKKAEDDTQSYTELSGKFDEKSAVSLMLKLKKDFGSLEKVLDEYLFSLQAGISLEEYSTDKQAYQKQKDEKSLTLDQQKIITMAKIEEKMLKKIQESNTKGKEAAVVQPAAGTQPGKTQTEDGVPKPPVPEVKDVKPKNPADEIMNEIKQVNPIGK